MWSAVLGFSNEADRKYSFYLQLTIFTTPFFRWPGKEKKKKKKDNLIFQKVITQNIHNIFITTYFKIKNMPCRKTQNKRRKTEKQTAEQAF